MDKNESTMKETDQRFKDYVKFTSEMSMAICIDTFKKGLENKWTPDEILSVFQSCKIIGARMAIDMFLEMDRFDDAKEVVLRCYTAIPNEKEELAKMQKFIEIAERNWKK